jgi:predicted phosphodiesterase
VRYGIISDIHANLHALDATLATLDQHGVDRYLCLGDLVGYGPLPNECVERLAAYQPVCVAGNHDLIATGRLKSERSGRLARDSLAWTAEQLSDNVRSHLDRLPLRTHAERGVVLVHGSLNDVEEYVRTSAGAARQLERLEVEEPTARILLLGHTHMPMAHASRRGDLLGPTEGAVRLHLDERYVLNPGSVGQSRERIAHARFMVLDTDAGLATYHAIAYDRRGCRRALRRAGRPGRSCHRSPTGLRAALGRTARRCLTRLGVSADPWDRTKLL